MQIARRPRTGWTRTGLLLGLLAVLFVACAQDAPQSALDPEGPVARQQHGLFVPVFWIAVVVFVLVEGLLLYILVRFRNRRGQDRAPTQVHGNQKLEIGWTLAPTVILAAIAVPTIGTIFSLSRVPAADERLDVRVIAHQWWWEIEYGEGEDKVVTANEIHIPTERTVYFTLEARNANPSEIPVVHSFWVPKLGGKQDVIPGRINHVQYQAEDPGVYLGQCAEFCGIAHAYMRLRVVAHEPDEFEAWLANERSAAQSPTEELARRGEELFQSFPGGSCMACHAINGLQGAEARIGPDLTHFGSRATFAGAIVKNTPENLRAWLDDPPAMKPGAKMPDYGLTPEQIDALVAYLLSLE